MKKPVAYRRTSAYRTGQFVLFGAIGVLLAALAFEFIGGYEPCPLCRQQRYAYYAAIPLAFAGLVLASAERAGFAALAFFLISLAFLGNAGLGVYHAGAEWKFWPGPDTCANAIRPLGGTQGGGVLGQLSATRVIRCDEAPWRFAGLSFAGWNIVASALLSIAALQAAFAASETAKPAIRPV